MNIISFFWSLPYLRWHIIFTFIPLILLWIVFRKELWQYKKTIFLATMLSFLWGYPFEFVAKDWLKVWYFTPHSLGQFMGLPIEEYFWLLGVQQEVAIVLLLKRNRWVRKGKKK